jgi:hypothetical protein
MSTPENIMRLLEYARACGFGLIENSGDVLFAFGVVGQCRGPCSDLILRQS